MKIFNLLMLGLLTQSCSEKASNFTNMETKDKQSKEKAAEVKGFELGPDPSGAPYVACFIEDGTPYGQRPSRISFGWISKLSCTISNLGTTQISFSDAELISKKYVRLVKWDGTEIKISATKVLGTSGNYTISVLNSAGQPSYLNDGSYFVRFRIPGIRSSETIVHRMFGDMNGDRIVNSTDQAIFMNCYTFFNCIYSDFDQNGTVNQIDYDQFFLRKDRPTTLTVSESALRQNVEYSSSEDRLQNSKVKSVFVYLPNSFGTVIQSSGATVTRFSDNKEIPVSLSNESGNFVVRPSSGSFFEQGKYRLTLDASKINSAQFGGSLDGDRDGVPGGNFVSEFYVFFGDALNQDYKITDSDISLFNAANGRLSSMPGYKWYFDFNGDNRLNALDNSQFQMNNYSGDVLTVNRPQSVVTRNVDGLATSIILVMNIADAYIYDSSKIKLIKVSDQAEIPISASKGSLSSGITIAPSNGTPLPLGEYEVRIEDGAIVSRFLGFLDGDENGSIGGNFTYRFQ